MKKKNLVILHLKSLSWEILRQQEAKMPFLKEIMGKSLVFNKFFSSATSSIMAFSDFLYGNNFELDNSLSLDNIILSKKEDNFFSILESKGYFVSGAGYPCIWRDDINNYKIWDCKSNFNWFDKHSDFLLHIDNCFKSKSNFAVYIWDTRSHLNYSDDFKSSGKTALERWEKGYVCLNETVKNLFKMLSERNLLKDTIVLAYGDHGDDFWTRSFNAGYAHAVAPHSNLIWTPAFIYGLDSKESFSDDLVSLVDLRKISLNLIDLNIENKFKYSGRNIFKEKNEYVFSQNLLANQKEVDYNGFSGLIKTYAVVNKFYSLIVSNKGLEMYAYTFDQGNYNNLLSFFELSGMDKIEFKRNDKTHVHFRTIFSDDQVEHIKENFYFLRQILGKRIFLKNKNIDNQEKYLFDSGNFFKIKSREFSW